MSEDKVTEVKEVETPKEEAQPELKVTQVKKGQLTAVSSLTPEGKVGTEIRTEFESVSIGDLESMVSGIAGSVLGVAYILARGDKEGSFTETVESRTMFLNILVPAIINVFNSYVAQQNQKTKEGESSSVPEVKPEVKEAEIV